MKRIIYSTLFFILLSCLLVLIKPSVMFDKDRNIKQFGIGEDKTMFSFGVCVVVIAVLSFYLFCIIDMIFD